MRDRLMIGIMIGLAVALSIAMVTSGGGECIEISRWYC
jgi:hypothetical protein